jgi:hypothetical protein
MSVKLSAVGESPFVHMTLLGESGAGKTVGALTAPGRIKVLDFDNKVESAARFYHNNPDLLSRVDVEQYGKMPVKGDAKTGRKPRMKAFLDDLQAIYNLQNNKQPLPFDTLVLDTISTLVDSVLEDYRYVSQTGLKRASEDHTVMQDYGLLAVHIKQIITGLRSLDCNVIVIGHTQREKDEATGIITNQLMLPGQMAGKLGIYFTESYFARLDSKGQRVWQTQADAKSPFCKTARNLPAEIPAKFEEIVRKR